MNFMLKIENKCVFRLVIVVLNFSGIFLKNIYKSNQHLQKKLISLLVCSYRIKNFRQSNVN